MVRLRLAGTLVGGLLFLTGSVWAEPAADPAAPETKDDNVGVWGDPEADQSAEPGWTWFGMGYERRMRGLGTEVGDAPGKAQAEEATNGRNGQ